MAVEREKYVRVTSVLYPFSGLEKINPQVVNHAAQRGTKVHKICEGIISGFGEIGVDDETKGYVESFKTWWAQGIEVVEMEKRFWDDELCVTGQVDLIIKTPEGLGIMDFKTSSSPSKTWQVQGAAYAYLAKNAGFPISKIFFLHLSKTGKPPRIHEYAVDDNLFLCVFKVWNLFFRRKDE